MSRAPVYIFDLDDTLADTSHRHHLLTDKEDPECWRRFFAACVHDSPKKDVIRIMETLERSGAQIWICTARSDEVYEETVHWLTQNTCFPSGYVRSSLVMRNAKDMRTDVDFKSGWFASLPSAIQRRVAGVFEDRDRVVEMWRGLGLTCFQVAPGDF